jgi:hypothetical protein
LYAPVAKAFESARTGDPSSIETLVRFLEADPYCFRSGYMKADIIHRLTRIDLDESTRRRLRDVLFAAIENPTRREFRRHIRLARYLEDKEMRSRLDALANSGREPAARHAGWIKTELDRKS